MSDVTAPKTTYVDRTSQVDGAAQKTPVDKTQQVVEEPNLVVENQDDEGIQSVIDEALNTLHDIALPKNFSPDALIGYLDSVNAKLTEVGTKLANYGLKNERSKQEVQHQKNIKQIEKNHRLKEKMKKKGALLKALAWAGAALSVVVAVVATVATVGAASPSIMAAVSCGAAMIGAAASVTSVALEQSGALEKLSPELRKGIEIALMVVQLACALVSIGAAVKSALSSIPKIATTALKATASGAAEGAAEGTAAATKTAEAAADAAIEASKASMKEMVEEAVKEAAKNAAKQVAKDTAEELAKTGGKELTKEAAEQIASKAVSSATKEAVSSVTKQIIDETLDKTARVVSKEVAEEIAKKAAAEVSKDIAKSVTAELGEASQVGSVVNEVAADAIAAGAKAAVEDISKYVIFKLTATIAEKFTSVASSGVAASEGVENIQTGQLAMKQSDLQKEISELVAAIQMTQHMIQTLIDWLKGIGEAYMNADQKGRELSENFSKSANLAIDGISAAPISPGAASV